MNLVPARLSALRRMLQGSFCFGAAMVLIIASGCGQTKVTSVHSESTPDARYKRIYVIIDNKDLPQDNREDIVRGMHTLFDPAFANGSITVKLLKPTDAWNPANVLSL